MREGEPLVRELHRLQDRIASPDFSASVRQTRQWRGADVVITSRMTPELRAWLDDQPVVIGAQKTIPRRRAVVTPYARKLSWLFHQLRDCFREHLDFTNKYDFFAILAQAALDYLDANKADTDATGLLLAVLSAARDVAGGME